MNAKLLVCVIVMAATLVPLTEPHSSGASPSSLCGAPFIDHMEFTQGLQHMHDLPNNSIELVDLRATTVRLYITIIPSSCGPQYPVDARLDIFDGGTSVFNFTWNSDNGPIMAIPVSGIPVYKQLRRLPSEDGTINFTFIPFPGPGFSLSQPRSLTFKACVGYGLSAYDINVQSGSCRQQTMTFHRRRSPVIVGYPINYTYTGSPQRAHGPPNSSLIQPGNGDLLHWAVWPFPESDLGPNPSFGTGGYHLGEEFELSENYLSNKPELLSQIDAKRLTDGADIAFGWLPANLDSGFGVNGRRFGFPNVAIGNAGDDPDGLYQWVFAHEIGHRYSGPSHTNGHTDEVGWDVRNRMGLGHLKLDGEYFNVMDNQRAEPASTNTWITTESYVNAKLPSMANENTSLLPPSLIRTVEGILPVDSQQDWILEPSFEIQTRHQPITPETVGNGEIRIFDNLGLQIYSTRFDAENPLDESNQPLQGRFSVVVPALQDIDRIELYHDGVLQDVKTRTSHVPQVLIQNPSTGTILTSTLTINWTATDIDGDALVAKIDYSHNGGATWFPLETWFTGNELQVNTSRLPGGTNGVVRIAVSDSLNTAVAKILQLSLDSNHSPTPYVLTNSDRFRVGSLITLVGSVQDPEDGRQVNLSWHSDRDGFLGIGPIFYTASLSAGQHTIELRAIDSGGLITSDFLTVNVQ